MICYDPFYRPIADTSRWMNHERQFQSIRPMIHTPNGKEGQPTHLKLVQPMMVNGLEAFVMAKVFRNGLMVLFMKENGKIIEHMEKENSRT